jgi:hypothetical protein
MFGIRAALRCAEPQTRVNNRKRYFDLKAFRKGISEKKQSLAEAEKREIDRMYAKPPPEGWTVSSFIKKSGIAKDESFCDQVAGCFDDWNDFISSSRKDMFRVSHVLTKEQAKKLSHSIELFNHGLFPQVVEEAVENSDEKPWSDEDDALLLDLGLEKYDYKFGDPWLYVSWEMGRTPDQVQDRFTEIYLRKAGDHQDQEVVLSKSFRPLLMNRQFRLLPPQCYIIPTGTSSSVSSVIPTAFEKYKPSSAYTRFSQRCVYVHIGLHVNCAGNT